METLSNEMTAILEIMSYFFVLVVGLFCLWVVVLYIIDKCQTTHSIRHNYPVIGRLRYVFEHLGVFFRQYFAEERSELPFNRAERSWVYRAAKDIANTVAFGSTKDIKGTLLFKNSMYPILANQHVASPKIVTIGEDSQNPYTPKSFFNISGMSYGAISKPAVRALSEGAKIADIWLNTGEGGLSPYHLEGGCDIVFQIGTAMFGVRNEKGQLSDNKLQEIAAYPQVKMIEIKLSQGAKPGKGGMLPGAKVTEEIAQIRGIAVSQDAISPNRFEHISNHQELLQMIEHVRNISGLPTGIKLCVGNIEDIEEFFKLIKKQGVAPDFMTIDGGDGGTGAAPMSLMDSVGLPITASLPQVVHLLKKYKLKERICIIASGRLITPVEVAWALCNGADFVNNARGFMLALGCIQAMQCNKDTCPTGITTHKTRLQAGLNPHKKAIRVANYAKNMQKEINVIAHSCGVGEPRELVERHLILLNQNKSS